MTFANSLLQHGVFIPLEEPFLSQFQEMAVRNGSRPGELAQRWVVERLERANG